MYKKIIWATDGSEEADLALAEARRLARMQSGRIVAVHCDQLMTGRAQGYPVHADEEDIQVKIRHQVAQLRQMGVDIELLVRRAHEHAADVVVAIANELAADVIVCGTHTDGALAGALHGSFARRVVHLAHCPVLVVPHVVAASEAETPRRVEVHA
jgi:nucleotide-binding universal stress UspA family protein